MYLIIQLFPCYLHTFCEFINWRCCFLQSGEPTFSFPSLFILIFFLFMFWDKLLWPTGLNCVPWQTWEALAAAPPPRPALPRRPLSLLSCSPLCSWNESITQMWPEQTFTSSVFWRAFRLCEQTGDPFANCCDVSSGNHLLWIQIWPLIFSFPWVNEDAGLKILK